MISETGNDRVGDLIQKFMEENGVCADLLSRYEHGQSAIALAFLNKHSDAEYQFYKDYPHQRLQMPVPEMTGEDLFLFGSFYALNPGIRPRMKVFLEKAREAEAVVLYDPNFRSTHLDKRDELLDLIVENITYATLVRASDEDLINIFGVKNADEAWEVVRPHCNILIYTANAGGVFLRTGQLKLNLKVDFVKPVSTIGAGDTFNAGILYGLYRMGCTRDQIGLLEKSHWEQILHLAIEFSREVCLSYDNYLPRDYAQQIIERTRLWKKENWADHP